MDIILLDCEALFQNLEIALASSLLPAIIGVEVPSVEHDLLSLPLQMEGLGISNPMSTASHCYFLTTHSTTSLVTFVIRASVFELDTHIAPVSLAKDHYRACFNDYFILSLILCLHYMILSNNVLCYMLKSFIIWLVVTITLCTRSVDLSPQQFRDALALPYKKPMLNLPGNCDGCGATFTIDHALDCHFGGVIPYSKKFLGIKNFVDCLNCLSK